MAPMTLLGYVIDGHGIDVNMVAVALATVPASAAWANAKVWWFNRNPANAGNQKPYPFFVSWDKTGALLAFGSALVPLSYLVLAAVSQEALKELMESSRGTMAIGGLLGIVMSLKEIFK